MKTKDQIIDEVIQQIIEELEFCDATSLAELLSFVPEENLLAFLPEK